MAQRVSTNRIVSARSLKRKRRKILIWVAVLLVLGILIYGIYGNVLKVGGVSIEGNKHTDSSEIQLVADTFLNDYRLRILPQNNVVFFPTKKFKEEVMVKVAGVDSIAIDFNLKKEMNIQIGDRKPMGIWCNEGEDCYFFDNDGILFKPSFLFTGSVFTVWYEAGKNLALGDTVSCGLLCVDQKYVNFLAEHKIKSAEITSDTHLLRSLYGYEIKASNDATTTIKHIKMLRAKDVVIEKLQYVDVRFPNKIFYK